MNHTNCLRHSKLLAADFRFDSPTLTPERDRERERDFMLRFKDRHGFSSLLKHLSARHKSKHYQTKVCIAADFPDAKPDASCLGDLGYHPLEEISNFERKKNIEHTDQRLTDAEIARTLTEINEKAVFFPLLWNDEDPIFGTEARFLVDEHGDFYFQTDDDGEFLETINDAGNQMNVSIGYDSIEDWILEHQEAQDEIVHNDSDDDSSDLDNDEEEEEWSIITTKDTKLMLGLGKESSEYLGDWSGFDSLRYIHPLDFADSLSSAALADNEVKIKKPSQSIRIIGEVQRLHGEEEKYVEQLFQDRFGNDSEEKNNNDSDTDDAKQSPGLVAGTPTGQEDNESVINSSTYRGLVGSTMEISITQKSAHSKSSEKSMLWPSEAGIGDSDDDIIMEFTVISPMDGDTEVEESEEDESDENESGVSFYKLDIQSIRVISFFGAQLLVDKVEFRAAKPDILARVGPDIIERLNTRGKVLEDALKSVCLHRKGLKVEEVMLLHLDSLGMDLRVHCGREIKTLRISFGQQAKTEGHAEKLLNELLFPETPRKGRQKRRSWP